MYLGVVGNIGTGKGKFIKALSDTFGWKIATPETDVNPYLKDYYLNMDRWSFETQIYFLQQHYKIAQKLQWDNEVYLLDHTIYEDAYIYTANLYDLGHMTRRDYECYMELFKLLRSYLPMPDMFLWLKAPANFLLQNIRHSQQQYEQNIDLHYLMRLNERYNDWLENMATDRVFTIETSNVDLNDANSKNMQNIMHTIKKNVDSLIVQNNKLIKY